MTLLQILSIPEVQALVATAVAFAWLTHVQAAVPPWLLSRIPAPLQVLLQVAAGNWGNAKNTAAPNGPASPLAALAITGVCAVLALGPAFLARTGASLPDPKNAAPEAITFVATLPADPTAAALSKVATADVLP